MWRFAEICNHGPDGNEDLFKGSIFTPMVNNIDSAYIAEFEERIIIAFEGTKNLKAWISDFDIFPLKDDMKFKGGPWGKGIIADGFYSGWFFFKNSITDYIKHARADFPEKSIFCTGHSRGGALATLCARHIAKNMKVKCSCISFGAPRQGNKKYREQMNFLPIYGTRVIHGYDIVPELPPRIAGFRHVFRKEWLPELCWRRFFFSRRVKDHYYSTYTKGLIKWCKKYEDEDGLKAMGEVLKRAHP